MIKIRSFLFFCLLLPTALLNVFFCYFSLLVTGKRPYWVLKTYGKIINFFLRVIGNISINITGSTDVRLEPSGIIIGNHVSAMDTISLPPFLKNIEFTFVIKQSLIEWKSFPFNLGCRALGCIPVSREANSGDMNFMMEEFKKRFDNNASVMIYPKGSRENELEPSTLIPPTALLMAKRLKVSVLPVFFDTVNWSNGKIIKDAGNLYPGIAQIHIGEVIPPEEVKNLKKTHQKILDFYQECYQKSHNIKKISETN